MNKRISHTLNKLMLAAGLAGVLLLPQVLQAGRALDGDPVHGSVLFKKHCASCHGNDAQGGKKGKNLNDGGLVNAVAEQQYIKMLHGVPEGQGLHKGLKDAMSQLDAWDVVAFLRSRAPFIGDMFPDANRYIVKKYSVDKFAKERLKKSLGRDVSDKETTGDVFTLFATKQTGALQLVPQDPRLLDGLKRPMKVGYVVYLPFSEPGGSKVQLAIALEPKLLRIANIVAVNSRGAESKDLNKLLSRFKGKGERRMSGQPKANLSIGGGGRQLADLEKSITDAYLRCLEMVTAYEVEERERSWADDDVALDDPKEETSTDDFSIK